VVTMTEVTEVWLVRDPGAAAPDVIAIYPSPGDARQFADTLNREQPHRKLVIEKWTVPGHE